jgi:hypothetical protein
MSPAFTQRVRPRGGSSTMAHVDPDRDEINFFPTPPWGARAGAEIILQLDPRARSVWEPACGAMHMVHGLRDFFPLVHASDKYLYDGNCLFDFVNENDPPFTADWIVSNPPFDHIEDFIRLGYARARRGVALLMRVGVLEGQERHGLLYGADRYYAIAPFSERLPMVKGRWDPRKSSAAFYAWFIWLKPGVGPRVRPPHPFVIDIPPGAKARLERPSDAAYAALVAA